MPEPERQAKAPPRRGRRGRELFWPTAIPGLIVTILVLALHVIRPISIGEMGDLLFDVYQRATPRTYDKPLPVKIVDIDDETLARLGQWPWPRTEVAQLTQKLADAGASSIALDIVFSEPDRTSPARVAAMLRNEPQAKGNFADVAALPDHDVILGQALARDRITNAVVLTHEPNRARPSLKAGFAVSGTGALDTLPSYAGAIVPLPVIDSGAAGTGFINAAESRDGIQRSAPLLARVGAQEYPSLSLESLRVAQGAGAILIKTTSGSGQFSGGEPGIVAVEVGNFEVPTTRSGALWMYYRMPRPELIPAWKIMTGAYSAAAMDQLFNGSIVFIGTSAEGLRDLVSTPLADGELGTIVHAEAVEQIIAGKFLTKPDWFSGLETALILLFGIGMSLLLPALGALRGGILAAGAFAASIAGSWFTFRYASQLLDPTYPALAVVSVYIAGTLFSFYREERARAYIHRAFDRYLSPELVARIERDPGQLQLGGEERDMTVLFCDIRSFSHISEKLTPQQVISFLIDFLTPMSDILLARKATIDKFIGDAIMAFWNAPLDDPDHARNAALGALDMIERLKGLNTENAGREDTTWPSNIRIGIGIESGPCYVGNIGSAQRLSYSLIGDTVNLASRIEGLTKLYGVSIALGKGAAQELTDFAICEIDAVRVVGRDTTESIHTLLGPPELTSAPDFRELATTLAGFLKSYRAQDWDAGEMALTSLGALAPRFGLEKLLQLYRARIETYRKSPPPADWDGVYAATEK